MHVINFGSMNIDYVYQMDHFVQPGETQTSLQMQAGCGGKGLNQSVALARAGVPVVHVGFVGKEGLFLVDKLRQAGVDTRWIETVDKPSGHAIIQVDRAGQNCILLYQGTNHMLTEAYIDRVLDAYGPEDVVLLQNETNLVGTIMEKAAARGMRIAFNAAPMTDAVQRYPLEKVTWLFVNELEGAALSGETDYDAIVRVLRSRWPKTELILTLGSEGSLYAAAQGVVRTGICHVQPVDTTAAGDTFTGYFLRGVLMPCRRAPAELATIASAMAVQVPGAADSVPPLDAVLASALRSQL